MRSRISFSGTPAYRSLPRARRGRGLLKRDREMSESLIYRGFKIYLSLGKRFYKDGQPSSDVRRVRTGKGGAAGTFVIFPSCLTV